MYSQNPESAKQKLPGGVIPRFPVLSFIIDVQPKNLGPQLTFQPL
jgi:hypothetical protein